ncbi:hypothetical protein EU537_04375 [Candidatus Thorarchaeota archaeon]|nr:MAG: hypothetical protein EU537_04375 [Candidatus Thorarchaeota archaeon]
MTKFRQFFDQKRGEVRRQRRKIQEMLTEGAATVSQLSSRTEYPKDLIVWNLMGMLRWGQIEVTGHENEELVYSLKEE